MDVKNCRRSTIDDGHDNQIDAFREGCDRYKAE